jgi:hypothetical protein
MDIRVSSLGPRVLSAGVRFSHRVQRLQVTLVDYMCPSLLRYYAKCFLNTVENWFCLIQVFFDPESHEV